MRPRNGEVPNFKKAVEHLIMLQHSIVLYILWYILCNIYAFCKDCNIATILWPGRLVICNINTGTTLLLKTVRN